MVEALTTWRFSFREFLRKRKASKESTPTHLSIDGVQTEGGKFVIPFGDHEKLFKTCSYIIQNRETEYDETNYFYLSECATEFFRMFIDIDVKKVMSDEFYTSAAVKLSEMLSMFYPSASSETFRVVCTRPRKGHGLHLHCPNVTLTIKEAMTIYLAFKDHYNMQHEKGCSCSDCTVYHAIDSNVYKSGLRMLGSSKCSKKQHVEGREYEVFACIDNMIVDETLTASLKQSIYDAIKTCSIASSQDAYTKGFNDKWVSHQRGFRKNTSSGPSKRRKKNPVQLREYEKTSEVFRIVTRLIQTFDEHYKDDVPVRISFLNSRNTYRVELRQKFCLKKGCEHSGNNIFFEISAKGISQNCYNDKEDGCKHKKPVSKPLSQHDRDFLNLGPLCFMTMQRKPSMTMDRVKLKSNKLNLANENDINKCLGILYKMDYKGKISASTTT